MQGHKQGRTNEVRGLFRRQGGVLRTRDALRLGVHPRTLYQMREAGDLEQLSRGLYRLRGLPKLSNPDLVTVSLKIPRGVICLISALAFHNLTTQVPHQVWVALPRGAEPPRISYPPTRIFWFTEPAFSEGVETHKIDGTPVRVYGAEKTVADCFKYRNKIGLDVALEALKLYRQRRNFKADELLRYAAICRVQRVIRPYLEALL
jgi:predicted transcriptional regulator of viral defense system